MALDLDTVRIRGAGPSCGNPDCGCCGGLSRRTPLEIANLPGQSAIGYRIGRHGDFKASLIDALSARDPALARLTTRDDGDFSIALADAFATVAHVLAFYQERYANEHYLRTATDPSSVLQLARLIGYEPRPGVAASAPIAFTLDAPQGLPPARADLPAGVKVQSVPGPGEKPQVFETVEAIEARAEWNSLAPQVSEEVLPKPGSASVYLQGANTRLKPGDALLLVAGIPPEEGEAEADLAKTAWYFRRVKSAAAHPAADGGNTLVTWQEPLEALGPGGGNPLAGGCRVFALRLRANVFGYNAPSWRALPDAMKASILGLSSPDKLTPDQKKEWPGFRIYSPVQPPAETGIAAGSGMKAVKASMPREKMAAHRAVRGAVEKRMVLSGDALDLDSAYPEIRPQGFAVLAAPATGPSAFNVKEAVESARDAFGLAGKTTRLTLKGGDLARFAAKVRETSVFAASEELPLAEFPLRSYPAGDAFAGFRLEAGMLSVLAGDSVALQALVKGMRPGRTVVVAGKRIRLGPRRRLSAALSFVPKNGDAPRTLPPTESVLVLAPPSAHASLADTWIWPVQDDLGAIGTVQAAGQDIRLAPARESDPDTGETAVIMALSAQGARRTLLRFTAPLAHCYDRATVALLGNVALATQGETRTETLGSGDPSQAFQGFLLKQPPLTYVPSSESPGGGVSTLKVFVNGVEWKEVPSLYGAGPRERVFMARREGNGQVTVRFGDGVTGARPPAGQDNITAVYRQGVGLGGMVKAGQLSVPLNKPLGVRSLVNPLDAYGADDPEALEEARANAPLTVLTLDRIVSAEDFAQFARSFSGIAKAQAAFRAGPGVFLTVAGPQGDVVAAETLGNLLEAMARFGDPLVPVQAAAHRPASFRVSARLKLVDGYRKEPVLKAAAAALAARFAFAARDFGQGVSLSEVMETLQGAEGVSAAVVDALKRKDVSGGEKVDAYLKAGAADPAAGLGAELLLLDSEPPVLEILP